MMEIIVASHNKNKIKEFKEILKDTKIEIISLTDLNDYEEVEETGQTFQENAIIKATAIAKKYHKLAIADDSGLEVDYLNKAPGIYSARYSGKGDHENNLKVLKELEGVKNRSGRFISVIALVSPKGETKTYEGVWEGEIAHGMCGNNGFGYDVIFIPKGYNETAAELDPTVKNSISHRSIALKEFKQKFIND